MDGHSGSRENRALERLAHDVARLAHARRAVLRCGTSVIAQWPADAQASQVIAVQPFSAGTETYELSLLDEQPRTLTERECGAFQALTEMFRQALAESPPVTPPQAEASWVKEHVVAALDYVGDSFVLLLRDWTIQHVNTQFERMAGCRRTEIIGRNVWAALPQLRGTRFEAELRVAMSGTVPRIFEEFDEAQGRWLESRAFPCKEGLAVLTIDISERKSDAAARTDISQKLLHAQRMESLGTLAGGIAHDFNNILGAILGHVGLMRDLLPPGSPALENLEQVGIAGERARELVQQILAYSRSTPREFIRQPLRPLVEEALRLVRATLPASVQLRESLGTAPLATTLNATDVQQLVMNLCTNAWQALPAAGGVIRVELRAAEVPAGRAADVGSLAPGLHAMIVVADTGSGMSGETRAHVFEPFFTTKPRGQGTGLGLHVLSSIVRAHGGAISVSSQAGHGSEFAIYLPATRAAQVETVPRPPREEPRGHGERVAYVDDDEVVQLMVQRVLERAGFAVESFSDPCLLLDAVRVEPTCFDLLVTDFSMPAMNGLQVARAVRRLCPDIPIIIATGYASDDLKASVESLGHAEILHKERTFEELGGRAARAVHGARAAS